MRKLIIVILIVLGYFTATSQESTYNLSEEEASVSALFDSLKTARDDASRKEINEKIVAWWEEILQDEETFSYNFSLTDRVGILKSEDQKVRIYSWNVLYEGRRPKYYAFIQYQSTKKDEVLVWFLDDRSDDLKDTDQKTLSHDDWYGCLYYEIIPGKQKGETFYTLLGWDSNNALINRKIIDILWFSPSGKPRFGKTVFQLDDPQAPAKRAKKLKRMIFEYSARASMVLKYNSEKEFIFYDHLAPIDPKYKDMRQFYAPDMTQDVLRMKKGMWMLESDADLRRDPIKKDPKSKPKTSGSEGSQNNPANQF